MHFAINEATTMPHSFEEDVRAYSEAGFGAIEVWLDKASKYIGKSTIANARRLLEDHNLKPVAACFHLGVMLSKGGERKRNLDELRRKLEICQGLGAPILVVPSDLPERAVDLDDHKRAVDGISEAADLAKPYGVSLGVEFIKGARLIGSMRTALDLVRKSCRDNLGVVVDTFHLCAGISNIRDIYDAHAHDILLVHLNDVRGSRPMEIAEDADRVPPGQGALPLRTILDAIVQTGFNGYYSVELFSEKLWEQPPAETALVVRDSIQAFASRYPDA